MRALALVVLSSLVFAGCVGPEAQTPGATLAAPDVVAKMKALLEGVPCEAPVEDSKTSANIVPLSFTPFDGSKHAEMDARGDLLVVARYQTGGFDVLDISDPTAPALVSTYEGEKQFALDVKWSKPGDAVIIGTGDGVDLVDMADPAKPVLAASWRGSNAHMVDTHVIGGKEWIFLAPASNEGVRLLERAGWDVKDHGQIRDPVLSGGVIGPHDMTVLDDETMQRPILYVANGFEGWLAWDVSDPTKPVKLGGMINLDPAQGYLHTIQAERIGERRIVATISEVGVNALKVWDATDLSKPILLAEWQSDATRGTLPQHNLQLVQGVLYVAHYAKGAYVFDLKDVGTLPYVGTLDLQPIAHFVLAKSDPSAADATAFTNVWDVVVKDGVVFVDDENEGVHALGFGCLAPGDITQTSRG